jgi:hypothetical protein
MQQNIMEWIIFSVQFRYSWEVLMSSLVSVVDGLLPWRKCQNY